MLDQQVYMQVRGTMKSSWQRVASSSISKFQNRMLILSHAANRTLLRNATHHKRALTYAPS
jgi:hypothetical protein